MATDLDALSAEPSLEALTHLARGTALLERHDQAEARTELDAALDLGRRHGFHYLTMQCQVLLAVIARTSGDVRTMLARSTEAISSATRHGWQHSTWSATATTMIAHAALLRADPPQAQRLAAEGLAAHPALLTPPLRFALQAIHGAATYDQGHRANGLAETGLLNSSPLRFTGDHPIPRTPRAEVRAGPGWQGQCTPGLDTSVGVCGATICGEACSRPPSGGVGAGGDRLVGQRGARPPVTMITRTSVYLRKPPGSLSAPFHLDQALSPSSNSTPPERQTHPANRNVQRRGSGRRNMIQLPVCSETGIRAKRSITTRADVPSEEPALRCRGAPQTPAASVVRSCAIRDDGERTNDMDRPRCVVHEVVMAVVSDDHNADVREAAAREIVSGVGLIGGTDGLEEDLAVELALKIAELVERIATEEGLAAVDVTDVLLLE